MSVACRTEVRDAWQVVDALLEGLGARRCSRPSGGCSGPRRSCRISGAHDDAAVFDADEHVPVEFVAQVNLEQVRPGIVT